MERVLEPEVMDTLAETEAYDAMDHQAPNEAFVERLVALGVHGRVLDLGTGPGRIPLMLCDRVAGIEVVGIDLAETMLERARQHLTASPHQGRVEFRRADVKGLDFADHSFDVVCSNTILHHIPDPLPFLREAGRVLRPGGTLLIRDLYRPNDIKQVEKLVELHAADEEPTAVDLFRASLCAALTPAELHHLAERADLAPFVLQIDSDRHMSLQRSPRLP